MTKSDQLHGTIIPSDQEGKCRFANQAVQAVLCGQAPGLAGPEVPAGSLLVAHSGRQSSCPEGGSSCAVPISPVRPCQEEISFHSTWAGPHTTWTGIFSRSGSLHCSVADTLMQASLGLVEHTWHFPPITQQCAGVDS